MQNTPSENVKSSESGPEQISGTCPLKKIDFRTEPYLQHTKILFALAHPDRLRVLTAIAMNKPKSIGVSSLATIVQIPTYTASEYVHSLEQAGLVTKEKSGQYRLIKFNYQSPELWALIDFLKSLIAP